MAEAPSGGAAPQPRLPADRQREEGEEAAQQAEAPASPTDGAASQRERNAPQWRGKNLVKVADALKKRALEERDEADANAEKKQKSLTTIAKQWICPITLMLPTEPVKAEDGHTYEREAIEDWLAQNATSPVTRAHMGTRLMDDYAAKNTIEELVTSGAIAGEIAEAWKEKLEDEQVVKELRADAEGGDGKAMFWLGTRYTCEDDAQARAWFERSAATRDPTGMAYFGDHLLKGWGGPQDNIFGIMNVTEAAGLGSDFAALLLGRAFLNGNHGLPKDPVRARFWLKKIADGTCEHKILGDECEAEMAKFLRELDGGAGE